ncbi:LuxR C-terminal-related transcriptional regulator [Streptomyces swartbergensis]|uniref:LuxR C-terminal-related transcriptional regulator n=1 Tax=Streptomyces swartbergensis TaxID=487165 RepID=UPI0037FC0083
MHTVILAGGPTLVRAAVTQVVERSGALTVVGQAAEGAQLRDLLTADAGPDVILLDRAIRPQGISEFSELVSAASAVARTLVFGALDAQEADVCLRAGATGVLAPDITAAQLTGAMETVLRGGLVVVLQTAPAVTVNARRIVSSRAVPLLSRREREILTLLASGHEGSAVADVLSLSPLTVKTHIANMLTKLGVRHRGQLITFAYENGIVVPGMTPVDPFVDQLAEAS